MLLFGFNYFEKLNKVRIYFRVFVNLQAQLRRCGKD